MIKIQVNVLVSKLLLTLNLRVPLRHCCCTNLNGAECYQGQDAFKFQGGNGQELTNAVCMIDVDMRSRAGDLFIDFV